MHIRTEALRDRLRGSLWFLPAVFVVVAILLGALTLQLDHAIDDEVRFGFGGSFTSATTVLSTIAGAIITLTALVFSITVVALQLASSQYSPRVLRSFLRDRRSQLVLGVFLGTFAYTMVVLRSVRDERDELSSFVPAVSVHVAFALTGLSLAFFVFYVHHIAQTMQASVIVANVADETRVAVERLHPRVGDDAQPAPPAEWRPDRPARQIRWAGPSGYLQAIDEDGLLAAAVERDGIFRIVPCPGDFLARSSVVLEAWVPDDEDCPDSVDTWFGVGRERTTRQDPAFGFRQLVDIAERALSPGVNDPTTAVQCIDRLYELLLCLGDREIPAPHRVDDEDRLRLIVPRLDWDDFVRLAFEEIRQYGETSMQVSRRLRTVLTDLQTTVPPLRREALREEIELLDRSISRGFPDAEDRRRAADGDRRHAATS